MITSTTSTDRTSRPEPGLSAAPAGERAPLPRADRISTGGAVFLHSELSRQPEIRPEVVARARALAADPSYPPPEVLKKVAAQILASPDLSEDES